MNLASREPLPQTRAKKKKRFLHRQAILEETPGGTSFWGLVPLLKSNSPNRKRNKVEYIEQLDDVLEGTLKQYRTNDKVMPNVLSYLCAHVFLHANADSSC